MWNETVRKGVSSSNTMSMCTGYAVFVNKLKSNKSYQESSYQNFHDISGTKCGRIIFACKSMRQRKGFTLSSAKKVHMIFVHVISSHKCARIQFESKECDYGRTQRGHHPQDVHRENMKVIYRS